MKTSFNILKEDLFYPEPYNKLVRSYVDSHSCPFQAAFIRQFPEFADKNMTVGIDNVNNNHLECIAVLENKFGMQEYSLLRYEGIEFSTSIDFSVPAIQEWYKWNDLEAEVIDYEPVDYNS
jgi:hypothetical protein